MCKVQWQVFNSENRKMNEMRVASETMCACGYHTDLFAHQTNKTTIKFNFFLFDFRCVAITTLITQWGIEILSDDIKNSDWKTHTQWDFLWRTNITTALLYNERHEWAALLRVQCMYCQHRCKKMNFTQHIIQSKPDEEFFKGKKYQTYIL